jgi:hypothetical protein
VLLHTRVNPSCAWRQSQQSLERFLDVCPGTRGTIILQRKESIASELDHTFVQPILGFSAHRLSKVVQATCAPFTVVLAFSVLLTIIFVLY